MKMRRTLYFLVVLFLFGQQGLAQNIVIEEQSEVTMMMRKFMQLNRATNEVDGYRIQISATNDRRKMESALAVFRSRFPQYPVSWKHTNPFYRVTAGAFANELEAKRALVIIKSHFPKAYLVKAMIRYNELLEG